MSAPTDKKETKTEEKKKGLSTKAKCWIIGICIPVIPLLIWLCTPPSPKAPEKIVEPRCATIVITTSYPGIPIHVNPDQNITAAPIMGNVAWEKAVNGVPVRRFPLGGSPIDLVDPDKIGVIRTVAYRILENQGIDRAEIAYVKYRGSEPPSDWYDAALNNRQ